MRSRSPSSSSRRRRRSGRRRPPASLAEGAKMARGFARVTLVGNLTRDPELRQTPGGTSVCQFGVAVGRRYKDAPANGSTRRASSTWWYGARRERTAPSTSAKGRQVAIDGRLEQRSLGSPGRHQAQQGRDHRRERGVPRRPRRRDARAGPAGRRQPARPRRSGCKTIFVTSISGATTSRSSRSPRRL